MDLLCVKAAQLIVILLQLNVKQFLNFVSHSQAFLEFFFCQLHLLWVFGFSVKLNHSFVLLEHALKNAHLAAVSQTFVVEVFPWGLAFLDHALLNQVDFLGPVIDSFGDFTLSVFSSSDSFVNLCEACSVSRL